MPTPRKKIALPERVQAIGYIRVSTIDQADSGLSLEAQRSRIEAQCLANDWELVRIYEDAGASAKTLDRPALQEALAAIQPGQILLALKLDRLLRNVQDMFRLQETLDDKGANWATVQEKIDTSSAMGRFVRLMMAGLAELERGQISERTVVALGEKKVRRERLGTTPLGYRTVEDENGVKRVVRDSMEMATVEYARQLHRERCTLRQIADTLTREGHRTKRGGKWEPMTVKRLIEPRYIEQVGL